MGNPLQVMGPLDQEEWIERLSDVAERAENLDPDAPPAERISIASNWFELCWLGLSPTWIARCCRCSALLGESVLVDPGALDQQLLATHETRVNAVQRSGVVKQPKVKPPSSGARLGRPPSAKPAPAVVVEEVVTIADRISQAKASAALSKPPLRPIAERLAARTPAPEPEPEPAPPAPEPEPDADDEAPMPSGWGAPEQVLEALEPITPAPEEQTLSTVELAAWWGLSVPWAQSLHRRGVLQLGIHYRKHFPGEPKGNRFFPAAHQAISEAIRKPIPPAPLQTVEECLRPRIKRRVRAEEQGAQAED
jgi:hypothetical protein